MLHLPFRKLALVGLTALLLTTGLAFTAAPAKAQGCAAYYHVRYGDTLAGIARYYGVTVAALQSANGIYNANYIYAGQPLCIPVGHYVPPSNPGYPGPNTNVYIVQRGDTLSRLAVVFGTTVDALARYNNIYNYNLLYAGQRIVVPR